MIILESEAHKKFCPLILACGDPRRSDMACRGSRCMAWREVDAGGRVGNYETQPTGYCGVAGVPGMGGIFTDYTKLLVKLTGGTFGQG